MKPWYEDPSNWADLIEWLDAGSDKRDPLTVVEVVDMLRTPQHQTDAFRDMRGPKWKE